MASPPAAAARGDGAAPGQSGANAGPLPGQVLPLSHRSGGPQLLRVLRQRRVPGEDGLHISPIKPLSIEHTQATRAQCFLGGAFCDGTGRLLTAERWLPVGAIASECLRAVTSRHVEAAYSNYVELPSLRFSHTHVRSMCMVQFFPFRSQHSNVNPLSPCVTDDCSAGLPQPKAGEVLLLPRWPPNKVRTPIHPHPVT